MHGADGCGELDRVQSLPKESARPGTQRREHVIVLLERREDKDAGRGKVGVITDTQSGFNSVEYGHPDVHEHDVGLEPACVTDCLGTV